MPFLFSEPSIVVQVDKNAQEVAQKALFFFKKELHQALLEKKTPVFILPTGSTPLFFYQLLIHEFKQKKLDLSQVYFFNMDEYASLSQDHPSSFALFLYSHLLNDLLPGLNEGKIKKMGLRLLTSSDLSRKKQRKAFNQALSYFIGLLLSFDEEEPKDFLDKCLLLTREKHPLFSYVVRKFFNDQTLPSLRQIEKTLVLEKELKSLALNPKHLFLLHGDEDLQSKANTLYKEQLNAFLDSSSARVICFAGIGQNPSHIAFNDLTHEPFTNQKELSSDEKNQRAIQTTLRVASLTETTRKINAPFFDSVLEKVPLKAQTLGFDELFRCEHIFVLATGKAKMNSLYQTFFGPISIEAPSSLLRLSHKAKITFLTDEASYGVGEKKSLFDLNLNSSKSLSFSTIKQAVSPTFWEAAQSQKCFHLNAHEDFPSNLQLSLPEGKKILWMQEGSFPYSLFHRFKAKGNSLKKVKTSQAKKIEELLLSFQPDLIFLPYTPIGIQWAKALEQEKASLLKKELVLGLFYDCEYPLGHVFYPLSRKERDEKVFALKHIHRSQSKRLPFDEIASKMSEMKHPHFRLNESFFFYELKEKDGKIHLVSAPKKGVIQKRNLPFFKSNPQKNWCFSSEDQVLAIAPHPDDIEIGLGGLLQHFKVKKVKTTLLLASSGNRAEIFTQDILHHPYLSKEILERVDQENGALIKDQQLKGEIRKQEALKAALHLHSQANLESISFPFYETKELSEQDRRLAKAFFKSQVSSNQKRLFVFLPFPIDQHKTHRLTHDLFLSALKSYCLEEKSKVYVVYYLTPWSGNWNLYDFSSKEGSILNALIGRELLTGMGQKAAINKPLKAHRYQVFFLKN